MDNQIKKFLIENEDLLRTNQGLEVVKNFFMSGPTDRDNLIIHGLIQLLINIGFKKDLLKICDMCGQVPERLFMSTGVKEINLPTQINEIQGQAFKGCENLEKINLERIHTFGNFSFYKNVSLKDISFSDKLISIGKGCFGYCTSLEEIEISSKNYTIDAYAFEKCKSLKEVRLLGKPKGLGYNCFYGCSNLEKLVFSKYSMSSVLVGSNNCNYMISSLFGGTANENLQIVLV